MRAAVMTATAVVMLVMIMMAAVQVLPMHQVKTHPDQVASRQRLIRRVGVMLRLVTPTIARRGQGEGIARQATVQARALRMLSDA
jgi:uncharacterized membrane protein